MSYYQEILFQRNGAISPSPWYILVLCCFRLFPNHVWVCLIISITDYIQKYFGEESHYCYISLCLMWPLSAWLCGITFCSNLISAKYFCINVTMPPPSCLFSPIRLLWPLVGITDYNGSTLLSNNTIDVYHYFIKYPYCLNCAAQYYLLTWFQSTVFVSWSPWFIVVFCCLCLFSTCGWVWLLVGVTDYFVSTLLSDHIIAIYHYFIQDPYQIGCLVSYYLRIYSSTMATYHHFHSLYIYLIFFVSFSWNSVNTCSYHWLYLKYFA